MSGIPTDGPSFLLQDVDSRFRVILYLDKRHWKTVPAPDRLQSLAFAISSLVISSVKVPMFLDALDQPTSD